VTMITFTQESTRFNFRVAGVVVRDGHILLGYPENGPFWVLPGGRAELLETSQESLEREISEELGCAGRAGELLWIVENFFTLNGVAFHELGMYYRIYLPEDSRLCDLAAVQEIDDGGSHWIFRWHEITSLTEIAVRPAFLTQELRSLPAAPRHVVVQDRMC
jgi:8-oxo-dGTP pyrophosphatase MutT (NUDIX family)